MTALQVMKWHLRQGHELKYVDPYNVYKGTKVAESTAGWRIQLKTRNDQNARELAKVRR